MFPFDLGEVNSPGPALAKGGGVRLFPADGGPDVCQQPNEQTADIFFSCRLMSATSEV